MSGKRIKKQTTTREEKNGKTLVKISKHQNQNKNESKKETKAGQEDKFVPEM